METNTVADQVIRMRRFIRAIPGHGYELEMVIVKNKKVIGMLNQVVAIDKTNIRSSGAHHEIYGQGWFKATEAEYESNIKRI